MAPLRLKDVIEGREEDLDVRQIYGAGSLGRLTGSVMVERHENVGEFLRAACEDAIIVLTPRFVSELTALPRESRENVFQKVTSNNIPLIAVSETERIPDVLIGLSKLCGIAVLASGHDEFLLTSRIAGLLRERIASAITVHGVLVNVSGIGVMIVGESGSGKTECSCRLINRGHRWIADDAIEIEKREGSLYGRSHASVRGLIDRKTGDVVSAEEFFGASAIEDGSKINLVVELKNLDEGLESELCGAAQGVRDIMGVRLPCREIPGFPATRDIYRHVESAVHELINEQERGRS